MEVEKVFHMNGGEGQTSYAQNSSFQRKIMQSARSVVEEAVLELCGVASSPDKLSVADLGCSSGPNSLSVVTGVVDAVEERCRQLGRSPPEFQLFLNDLPGNDFNSVFRSLQEFHEERETEGKPRRRCFVAGVPGSFYGRLFQSRSVHFFHSSSSLHWLSQGYIMEEKVDTFNLPYYQPCLMEVEGVIRRDGSFSMKCLETLKVVWDAPQEHDDNIKHSESTPSDTARSHTNTMRAVLEPMLESHFGGDIIEDLFLRYSRALEEYYSSVEEDTAPILIISLVKEP
ncbi:hypothetical protein Taro_038865 [Colocasia esculenta]|uniref:Jasmonate O-methyltransferase n=1 Tax=Colocasia esculenta TaxID=4460 RepID=A0A843W972_COLES|nr:hypothetical protein [Colocasia esculenta]